MKRRSLEDILFNVKTGRTICPAGIRKAAVAVMEAPLREMVVKDEDNCWFDLMTLTSESLKDVEDYHGVSVALHRMYALHEAINTDLFYGLTALQMIGAKFVKRWLSFSAEDVLCEAGMEAVYTAWFRQDAEAWEKEKGRVVSINDILSICLSDESWNFEAFVRPFSESAGDYEAEEPFTPFRRDFLKGVNSSSRRFEEMKNAQRKRCRLQCCWVWFLMVEAPARIYYGIKDKE